MKEIFERISIRKFEDKPVEHEKTEQNDDENLQG